jgi:hypothetical protein
MMATATMRYTLETINSILFNGFDYKLPDATLETISNIALQVGAPDYVRTPVFQKRENPMKVEPTAKDGGFKRGRRNKAHEIISDDDWSSVKTFQPTKLEEKVGLAAQIDSIRILLNKMSDKNYIDMRNKIIEIIDKLVLENITQEDMSLLSAALFEIASNNRFYSKMYAELYSDLTSKYEMMLSTFETNFDHFIELFNVIEYVDPKVNYDKFCEINKINEKRKSLATFYLNLMMTGVIPKAQIIQITRNLLDQMYTFISVEDKKNEVDELTETIAILYKKDMYGDNDYELISGMTIVEVVEHLANSKVKDFKSLTNKSLFKFMDLVEM